VPQPVVCQPYYNLLNRMPEVEILPACDHYGIGVASYSPVARGVLTGKYQPGAAAPEGSRGARKDTRMMQTEFREESFAIAQTLKAHAAKTGRTLEQWKDYTTALDTKWSDEDEALVDSLVTPGHPSTPGYNDPEYPFYGRRRMIRR
jgi:diketogulonate reductase-like aldo/keto reductase